MIGEGRQARALRRVVVYGDSRLEQRTEATVLPWSMLDRMDWATGALAPA